MENKTDREHALDILLWQDVRKSQELLEVLIAERSRAHDLAVPHDETECDSLQNMKQIAMNGRFGFVQLAPGLALVNGVPDVQGDPDDEDDDDTPSDRPLPVGHRTTTRIKNGGE